MRTRGRRSWRGAQVAALRDSGHEAVPRVEITHEIVIKAPLGASLRELMECARQAVAMRDALLFPNRDQRADILGEVAREAHGQGFSWAEIAATPSILGADLRILSQEDALRQAADLAPDLSEEDALRLAADLVDRSREDARRQVRRWARRAR